MRHSATPFLCFASLAALPAIPPLAAQSPAPPALVVVLVADQMRADHLERFRNQYTGGLGRLLREGAWLTNAWHDHGITETAPGHASVLSGRYPYSTGIVRNDEGVPDTAETLIGANGAGASPHRFRGTSLLDWVRVRWPEARMLSISRKDRSAILPVGRSRSGVEVYWYAGVHITTSTYYAHALPEWVRAFDARSVPARAPNVVWRLLRPPGDYAEPDSLPWENRGAAFTFPHPLSHDSLLQRRPWMDSLLLAFALEGQRELRLGATTSPDIIAVSLSTTDAIGHEFGPDSREVHDQILWLDRYLGAFLDSLERRVGRGRMLVALTSDHGMTTRPENAWAQGHRAAFVMVDSVIRPFRDELAARLGPGHWVPWRDVGMVALDRIALARRGLDVDSLAAVLADRLRAFPGVAQVDTRRTLVWADTVRNTPARRWQRMLAPGTLGEVFITLEPRNYMGRPRNFQHGQASDDDAHVPIVVWGPGVRRGVYREKAAVVDLGPTLAALLGVAPTEPVDGRVVREIIR